MKNLAIALITLTSLTSVCHADDFFQYSGTYQVIQNDCNPSLSIGNTREVVEADENGIRIGEVFSFGSGGPNAPTHFVAAFTFKTGETMRHNMGSGYHLLNGSYSENFLSFYLVDTYARFDGETPVFQGETQLDLSGDILKIHVNYGLDRVCILKKL